MEMDHIEIKEEHHDNFFVEHQNWDEVQVKEEPKTEITIDDNILQLPQEMKNFSLTELITGPHVTFKEDPDEAHGEALHNSASLDPGMQFLLNVKPSSQTDCEIPSVHQYSGDTLKKKIFQKRQTSFMLIMGIHIRKNESIKKNIPLSQYQLFNPTEKNVKCDRVNPYTCEICHKCFSTLCNLKTHIRIHTESKPYTCDICHKCFSQSGHLKTHRRIHTGSKPYTCDKCAKSFSQPGHLKTHRRIHTGSKPFTCDVCHKCFIDHSALNRHRRIHTGSKPYTCDTCYKCFRDLSTLTTHIRIHTGSKPYTCEICLHCFTTKSGLKKHVRLHTENKPYSCDTCHKCFSDASNLKKHVRLHTGSKPYICETCHNCFSQSYTLKRHIRTHTKNQIIHL